VNYALNYPHVSFSLKKRGDKGVELKTPVDSTFENNFKLLFAKSTEEVGSCVRTICRSAVAVII
jgi:hypothetical protein